MGGRDVTHTGGGIVTVCRLTEAAVYWTSDREADLDLDGIIGRDATDPLETSTIVVNAIDVGGRTATGATAETVDEGVTDTDAVEALVAENIPELPTIGCDVTHSGVENVMV